MKRRIVPLLSAIITAALFLSCALPADDEIRLISPKDEAILDVDALSKDTCFQLAFSCYHIWAIVPLRWESCSDTAVGGYEIEVHDIDSNRTLAIKWFPVDSTLCYTFSILVEIGRIGEDGSLIPDTTAITNMGPLLPFPRSCEWRVDGYSSTRNDWWRIAESEIWSFTVVKD